MCHGQKSRFVGDKLIPPLNRESLFHGAQKNPVPELGGKFPIPPKNGSLDPRSQHIHPEKVPPQELPDPENEKMAGWKTDHLKTGWWFQPI